MCTTFRLRKKAAEGKRPPVDTDIFKGDRYDLFHSCRLFCFREFGKPPTMVVIYDVSCAVVAAVI